MTYKTFALKLYSYLKKHLGKLIFSSLMMVLSTVLESSIPEVIGQIIDVVFVNERNAQTALFYAFILFTIIAMSAFFTLLSKTTNSSVSNKVIMSLRANMFAKLLKLPKSYFDQHTTGEILSKLTYDVEQISDVASSIWLEFVKSFIFAMMLIGYLFYKNWLLSLSLIAIIPLLVLAIKLSSSRMRNSSTAVQQSMGGITHLLDENISGNSLVKIYHAQKQEGNKFNDLIKNICQQRFKMDVTSAMNVAFINTLLGLSLGSVLYFAAIYLQMSAGEFLSFFMAMMLMIKPVKNLININKPLQTAIAAGRSVFGLIDEKEEENLGKKQLKSIKGAIEFKGVCFNYPNGVSALNQIDLSIQLGETVALVGSTGSGKTTIIQLLSRFYLPSSGTISIDGVDINEFEVDSLRSQIALIDQNVQLFNGSVRDNIALGQMNNMTNDKIENAAKIANVYNFVQSLSKQFDSKIGEDGMQLSGGQRQRLAIARAIAKDSPILILDEATAALDSATEKKVQIAINQMQKNRTTIIIAHRLSTIKNADKIVVLDQGKIIEQGNHQTLLDIKGKYATLYQQQFSNY